MFLWFRIPEPKNNRVVVSNIFYFHPQFWGRLVPFGLITNIFQMAWGKNHQTRSIMSSLGGFPSLSASLGGKKLTPPTLHRPGPPWRGLLATKCCNRGGPKRCCNSGSGRDSSSHLGSSGMAAVFGYWKNASRKKERHQKPMKNGGKFGNNPNSL